MSAESESLEKRFQRRVCAQCGREFTSRHAQQVCCSPACQKARTKASRTKYKYAAREVRCEICGATFRVAYGSNKKFCSKECAKAARKPVPFAGVSAGVPVSLDAIMRAKTKPKGVSPVRWRMELRRRARLAQFDGSEKARSIYEYNTLPAEYCW